MPVCYSGAESCTVQVAIGQCPDIICRKGCYLVHLLTHGVGAREEVRIIGVHVIFHTFLSREATGQYDRLLQINVSLQVSFIANARFKQALRSGKTCLLKKHHYRLGWRYH